MSLTYKTGSIALLAFPLSDLWFLGCIVQITPICKCLKPICIQSQNEVTTLRSFTELAKDV
jgi:hypothetical protein